MRSTTNWLPLLLLLAQPISSQAEVRKKESWLQAEAIPVAPGTAIRWPGSEGEQLEQCRLDQQEAPSLNGDCFFPIDLLASGELLAERISDVHHQRVWLRVGDYPYPEQHIKLNSNRHVNLSDSDAERAAEESARIRALWSLRSPQRFTLPLGAPLDSLPAGGRFGSRRFYNGEPRSPHTGADYAADSGTPVLATADGTVVLAEEHFFGGKSVFVDHGGGLVSMVLHLSEIEVEKGHDVRRGDVLGKVGSTGRSTGPHLHFGLRWFGARVDPKLLLEDPKQWEATAVIAARSP